MTVNAAVFILHDDGKTWKAIAETNTHSLLTCFSELSLRMAPHIKEGRMFEITIEIAS